MKKILILVIAMISLLFAQVKDYGNAGTAVDAIPAKITNAQKGKYSASVSAVGIGEHPSQQAAIKLARTNSSIELARSIEEEVSGLMQSFENIFADYKEGLFEETVSILVKAVPLRNAIYAEELVTKGNNGYTAYVLRVIPAASVKEMIDIIPVAQDFSEIEENVEQYSEAPVLSTPPAVITNEERTKMIANQAYQALEDRIAAEKAKKAF